MAIERLQKVLSRAGVASRRAAEELITGGKVRVDGRIVLEMGVKVDPYRQKVEVDGRRVVLEKPVYYVLNKPRKMVSTLSDPEGRDTIAGVVGRIPERVYPVGRLDYHTSGVLLITNDGAMTEALLRPKKAVPKVYIAKVQGFLEIEELDQLRKGVLLDDGYRTKPAELFVVREEEGCTWIQITLTEGKNRQVHRMFEAIHHRVMRLSRVSFADITVEGLRPGMVRPLRDREIEKLKKRYLNPAKHDTGHRAGGVRAGDRKPARVDFNDAFGDGADDALEGAFRVKPPSRGRGGARGAGQGEEARPSRGRSSAGARRPAEAEGGFEERPSRGRPSAGAGGKRGPGGRPNAGARRPAEAEGGFEERPSRGRPPAAGGPGGGKRGPGGRPNAGARRPAEAEGGFEERPTRGRPPAAGGPGGKRGPGGRPNSPARPPAGAGGGKRGPGGRPSAPARPPAGAGGGKRGPGGARPSTRKPKG